MAGGGIKGGMTHDDLHTTMLHLLGVQHTKLTYEYLGRHFRLTDVKGNVVSDLLA